MLRRRLLAAFLLLPGMAVAGAPKAAPTPEEDAVAFFRAVQLDDAPVVRAILARGMDPNSREAERSEPALVLAMRFDAMQVATVLLAQPRLRLEEEAPNGNTALMMAAFRKNLPALQAMLDKGARVNRPGWTALHYAAAAGADDIVTLLLARGAQIDARSPTGFTPLMMAAREGMEETVQLLLARGADATLQDQAWRMDAAQFADQMQKPWIAKAIRQHLAQQRR